MYICGQSLAPSMFNAMLEFYIMDTFSERIAGLQLSAHIIF